MLNPWLGWRMVVSGLALGLLGVPVVIALAALSGNGHRWIDILAQFVGPAVVPTVILLLVLTLGRFWIAGGVASVALALLLVAGWPQWMPDRGTPQPGAPVLTLYSANLFFENQDIVAIAASIGASKADIVVLVEVSPVVARAASRILPDYPYVVTELSPARSTPDVTLIASRYPLTRTGGPDVVAMNVVAQTPLGPLTVVGVHLTRPWPYQFQWGQISQIERVNALVHRSETGPVILAGDFNSVSSARIGRLIRHDNDMVAAPGWPGTWPSMVPAVLAMTIDQVYHTRDLAVLGRKLGRPTGSDHRPVITRLTLARPSAPR